MLLHVLRGTPFIFQGEELGVPDAHVPPDRVVDLDGRDPERAPIPWEPGPGGGFTTGTPWLPLVADADRLCVRAQQGNPASMLWLTRRLGRLRRESPALQSGTLTFVDAPPGVLAFRRELGAERLDVALNFTGDPQRLDVHDVVVSTDPGRYGASGELRPHEGVVLRA